jgi:hypothetical protein
LDDWRQAQQELSQATKPPPVTQGEFEPWVSQIANRYVQERMAQGELGQVAPGEGRSIEELIRKGMQMSPQEVAQRVRAVETDAGGDPVANAAAVRMREAYLSQQSAAASRASEADPANQQLKTAADKAFADVTNFHNGPVAKLKGSWSDIGRGLQGENLIDISTLNGMKEASLKDTGKAPPPSAEAALQKSADRVRTTSAAEDDAMRNLGMAIAGATEGKTLPSAEEVRDRIMKRMGGFPC